MIRDIRTLVIEVNHSDFVNDDVGKIPAADPVHDEDCLDVGDKESDVNKARGTISQSPAVWSERHVKYFHLVNYYCLQTLHK